MKVSIDKVILLSHLPTRELQSILCNSPNVYQYFPAPPEENFLYSHNFNFLDTSFLQLGNSRNARLTFNPNTCCKEIINDILPIFHKYPYTVSRLDIAIDYEQDLSCYFWFEKSGRRRIKAFRDNGKLNGTYFGSEKKSKISFIIYNKALQMKLHNIVWWRVEVRLKYPKLKNILPEKLFNPLCAGGVLAFPKKHAEKRYLCQFPEGIKYLSGYYKKAVRKWASASEDRLEVQPSETYALFRAEIFAMISKYILAAPTGENYSDWNTYDPANDDISYIHFTPDT